MVGDDLKKLLQPSQQQKTNINRLKQNKKWGQYGDKNRKLIPPIGVLCLNIVEI